MSLHLFHFRWLAMQFDECKKQLREGDVMFIMDPPTIPITSKVKFMGHFGAEGKQPSILL